MQITRISRAQRVIRRAYDSAKGRGIRTRSVCSLFTRIEEAMTDAKPTITHKQH